MALREADYATMHGYPEQPDINTMNTAPAPAAEGGPGPGPGGARGRGGGCRLERWRRVYVRCERAAAREPMAGRRLVEWLTKVGVAPAAQQFSVGVDCFSAVCGPAHPAHPAHPLHTPHTLCTPHTLYPPSVPDTAGCHDSGHHRIASARLCRPR